MSTKSKYSEIKNTLTGPIFTVFTPFSVDGEINYEQMEKYLFYLYSNKVRCYYVMPYNSRYSQLREDEIFQVNDFVIKTLKNLDKENFIIVSDCIHGPTTLSAEYGYKAFDSGTDMFASIVREKYFSDRQIFSHFDFLSQKLEMPLLVHEMPFISGYDARNFKWPLSLLERLKDIEHIVAIKEDAKDLEYGKQVIETLEPDVRVIFAGKKRLINDLYNFGLKSYLNGTSIVNPDIAFLFWKSLEKNDKAMIESIFLKIEDPFWDKIVSQFGWHRSNKAILEAAGLMDRFDRLPMEHLDENDFQIVRDFFEKYKDNFMKIAKS